ncbi:MAG: aminotransferase class IV [Brevinema sp.]
MINGELYVLDHAKISVMDHGVLYGDAIFEGIRIYNGVIFKLDEHMDRLYHSAELLGIEIDISKEQFIEDILVTARNAKYNNAYIRITVSVQAHIDLAIDNYKINRVIILLDDDIIPEEKYQQGIDLVEISRRRLPEVSLPMRAKTVNYLNNILALKEARSKGGHDAIMLNIDGYVSETSASNIFAVEKNRFLTPSLEAGILPGITRLTILKLASDLGYETEESLFTMDRLLKADEVFLTGTAYEIMPVRSVFGKIFPVGASKTQEVIKAYKALITQDRKYSF